MNDEEKWSFKVTYKYRQNISSETVPKVTQTRAMVRVTRARGGCPKMVALKIETFVSKNVI